MAVLIRTLSVLTAIVSGWMTLMFLLLHHPHYLQRAAMGFGILAGATAMSASAWRGPLGVRIALGVWAVALCLLGVWALIGDSGDDGWVLIAGIIFIAEGATSAVAIVRRAIVNT